MPSKKNIPEPGKSINVERKRWPYWSHTTQPSSTLQNKITKDGKRVKDPEDCKVIIVFKSGTDIRRERNGVSRIYTIGDELNAVREEALPCARYAKNGQGLRHSVELLSYFSRLTKKRKPYGVSCFHCIFASGEQYIGSTWSRRIMAWLSTHDSSSFAHHSVQHGINMPDTFGGLNIGYILNDSEQSIVAGLGSGYSTRKKVYNGLTLLLWVWSPECMAISAL